jgi:hypothetical protein
VILGVDRHARGLAHDPVVRQRLGPERIDLEPGRLGGVCGRHERQRVKESQEPHRVLPDRAIGAAWPSIERMASRRGKLVGDLHQVVKPRTILQTCATVSGRALLSARPCEIEIRHARRALPAQLGTR